MLYPTLVAGEGLDVLDPATEHGIATVKAYSAGEVASLIEAADAARPAWAARTAGDRAATLRRWHDLVMARQDDLAALVTAESGKPLSEARSEVAYGAAFIEWFAEEGKRAYGETVPSFATDKRVLTVKQPVGTCAAITPWNFPIAMITRKVAPALAAGCAMVVKPAEATPLSALALERLAHEAGIPPDLFRVVPTSDPASLGKLFCTHPLVRKLSFTGSTRVGQILMEQAAANLSRLSLELGGNAPFIVFDDADLDAAADGLMASKFRNAGQTCVCANRILVQERVHDAFLEKVKARVAGLVVGHGAEPRTTIGPLIDRAAVRKVQDLVRAAHDDGAHIVTGGRPSTKGPGFYEPTILTGVKPAMAIASSEIFGPVVPVIGFSDEAQAVRIANDTPYGLAAYFYTRDMGRIWRTMEALEYGMVGVNDGIISTEVAPFGGIKHSGFGREGSRHGLNEYLELKYCLMGGIDR
ncbi:NAD-dependent succinate-semialdehyde dehydrogenase [Rhizorhabdus sp. FW153]|uniref:NAD-dependent succinate-semialdehyde dehydrogenase n=1 Tax=Rhizorhabdus sp. FW153 TaxID=3400216 RepID=UPI003CEE78C5